MTTAAGAEKMAMESVTKLATEAISNIRTVASLSKLKYIYSNVILIVNIKSKLIITI